MNRKIKFFVIGTLAVIIAGTISWAFYQFINQGIEDTLKHFNVSNVYLQSGIIIFIGAIVLVLIGWKGSKVWKAVLGK